MWLSAEDLANRYGVSKSKISFWRGKDLLPPAVYLFDNRMLARWRLSDIEETEKTWPTRAGPAWHVGSAKKKGGKRRRGNRPGYYKAWYQRKKETDPEWYERRKTQHKALCMARYERVKHTPEYKAKQKEYNRRCVQRRKQEQLRSKVVYCLEQVRSSLKEAEDGQGDNAATG